MSFFTILSAIKAPPIPAINADMSTVLFTTWNNNNSNMGTIFSPPRYLNSLCEVFT